MAQNYYEVLGIAFDADPKQIKRAFRKISLKFHPDKNPGDKEADECFRLAAEAYEILLDEKARLIYDRKVKPPETLLDLFDTAGGKKALERFVPKGRTTVARGADQVRAIRLESGSLRKGTLLTYKHNGKDLQVRVPPTKEKYYTACEPGKGEQGQNEGEPGDLILVIIPHQHKPRQRTGKSP